MTAYKVVTRIGSARTPRWLFWALFRYQFTEQEYKRLKALDGMGHRTLRLYLGTQPPNIDGSASREVPPDDDSVREITQQP